MSRIYDNWERLVDATLKRQELRRLALSSSFSSTSSSSDLGSRLSVDLTLLDLSASSFLKVATDYATLSFMMDQSYGSVRCIEFKEIRKATRNFQWYLYLGQGENGVIYKGWMQQNTLTAAKGFMRSFSRSGMPVVIKKSKTQSMLGFKALLSVLRYQSQLDHPNMVKLVGYCCEREAMVLVYEFMPKGSLSYQLFTRRRRSLSWAKRIKVALGGARGLTFLHDQETQVVHGNFRVDNILLDAEYNAKLSGFAFAENDSIGDDTSVVSTRVEGRSSYVAPDYIATGRLTAEGDVFAFGVVLLEILSGCRFFTSYLVNRVEKYMNGETELKGIMDAKLEGHYPQNGAHAALVLAWQCLNPDPEQRPRMSDVVVVLQRL